MDYNSHYYEHMGTVEEITDGQSGRVIGRISSTGSGQFDIMDLRSGRNIAHYSMSNDTTMDYISNRLLRGNQLLNVFWRYQAKHD